jgi:hypothetical protein
MYQITPQGVIIERSVSVYFLFEIIIKNALLARKDSKTSGKNSNMCKINGLFFHFHDLDDSCI